MIVPWETVTCRANALRCIPYPTLQMYATYTPALDRWAARTIEAAAPQYVVSTFAAIDGRSPVLDAPEVWQSLLDRYDLVATDLPSWRLLLRKRARPRQRAAKDLPAATLRFGEWMAVPEGSGWLRAGLDVSLAPLGWLHRALYKTGPVALQVRYQSGRSRTFRLVPAVASDGLLIDGLPSDTIALAALFEGRILDRAKEFRLLAAVPREFAPQIPLRFRRLVPDERAP